MSSREGSGKKFHPFKYQTSLISKKHILLVAPASKNRFRKSGSEFSAKYHWAGLLALSVYVNSDIELFTLWRFTEVRSKVSVYDKQGLFRVFACACAQRERPLREERCKCDFDRFTFWCSSTISDNLSVPPSGYRLSPVAWNEYACRIRSRTVCALRVCVRVPCAQFVARPASIRKWRQENRYDVLSLVIVWIRVIPCTREWNEIWRIG